MATVLMDLPFHHDFHSLVVIFKVKISKFNFVSMLTVGLQYLA